MQPEVELAQFTSIPAPPPVFDEFSTASGKPMASPPIGAGASEGAANNAPPDNQTQQLQHGEAEYPEHQVHITFCGPRTRNVRPPWLSFSPPLNRSAVLRSP